jgi:flagellar hook-associated protein 1 FlgK
MSSLISDANLALSALMAQQQAIQATEQNVANANTPGYHRQSAVLAAAPSYALGLNSGTTPGLAGQGVTVQRLQRFTTDFLDGQYRSATAAASTGAVTRDALTQVQSTLNDTGSDGLTQLMDNFGQAWQALAADPTNASLRTAVANSGQTLAAAFNTRAQALMDARALQDQGLVARVGEVNQLAAQIAALNGQVAQA